MFELTLITYHAKLQVEPTVSDHFAVIVAHNIHHVIETQTAIPGWSTGKTQ